MRKAYISGYMDIRLPNTVYILVHYVFSFKSQVEELSAHPVPQSSPHQDMLDLKAEVLEGILDQSQNSTRFDSPPGPTLDDSGWDC